MNEQRTQKKLFPLQDGSGCCVPKGLCGLCWKPFIEVEPVGWVKTKAGRCYYHARCIRESKK